VVYESLIHLRYPIASLCNSTSTYVINIMFNWIFDPLFFKICDFGSPILKSNILVSLFWFFLHFVPHFIFYLVDNKNAYVARTCGKIWFHVIIFLSLKLNKKTKNLNQEKKTRIISLHLNTIFFLQNTTTLKNNKKEKKFHWP
jgi:hypothetical protein